MEVGVVTRQWSTEGLWKYEEDLHVLLGPSKAPHLEKARLSAAPH